MWWIQWTVELPMNYLANEASSDTVMTDENGFAHVQTPMYINCPDIGPVGTEDNPDMLASGQFQTTIDPSMVSNYIQGSDMSTILTPGVVVVLETKEGGVVLATVETSMMGAYEAEILSADVPDGTTAVLVKIDGTTIREIPVGSSTSTNGDMDGTTSTNGAGDSSGVASDGLVMAAVYGLALAAANLLC